MIYEFWGVQPPLPPSQRQIKLSDLTADTHDQNNWTLISLRFPELADVIPPPQFSVKTHGGDSGESGSQLARDLDRVKHLGSGASLADLSQALTGDRSYGGAMHKRLKQLMRLLKTSTTTPQKGSSSPKLQRKAA